MRRAAALGIVMLLGLAVVATDPSGVRKQAAPLVHAAGPADVLVTSAGDSVEPGASECPSDTKCTLRRAIELANADPGAGPFVIGFNPAVFPVDGATAIQVLTTPLPPITRAGTSLDGTGTGATIDGSLLPGGPTAIGVSLAAANTSVRGLRVRSFSGACISAGGTGAQVGGDFAPGEGNLLNRCGVGVLVTGQSSTIAGNEIGLLPGPTPGEMATGILVAASQVTVGGLLPGLSNAIGNTARAVQVGQGGITPITGVVIRGNLLGKGRSGQAAPITVAAIDIRQPSNGTLATSNQLAHAKTGIAVAADFDGVATTGNRLRGNEFANLGGLAIDLGADGLLNPNDPGDGDGGPNGLLNHPVFDRVVQSQITGSAGAGCAGCQVDLYVADHQPGSPNDYPLTPIAPTTAIADASGLFSFDNPAVSPGQWVIAVVTDAQGNTSEFGPGARVGAGLVQCGNVSLQPGWNAAGFFGTQTALGSTFPEGAQPPGPVSAIHSLAGGSENYQSWFEGPGGFGLATLNPGEPYWYYATSPVNLSGGFALNAPLPVTLATGWNDFVYIGAGAAGLDAFASIAGKYTAIWRYENDGLTEGWQLFGNETTPGYARSFSEAEACAAYRVLMTEPGTLTPPQP